VDASCHVFRLLVLDLNGHVKNGLRALLGSVFDFLYLYAYEITS
jgi:hypothetical protein